jgi:Na+-transporting NADH:ubiquinone oxidoreductase subunit NqrB
MGILNKIIGGASGSLIDKAVQVADKFIDTPEEKKAFIKEAYEQEIKDRNAARELGKSKATPDILTYITLAIAIGLAVAIFTDILDWSILTEVQKGLITTFSGFFLRTLGDVYGYWFGSSMGSEGKTKDLTKMMRK